MKIKFISSGDAEVLISSDELSNLGVSAEHISFSGGSERRMMSLIFDALEDFCGLRRDGKFALVECHPYLNGGCRLEFHFADEPSTRLYIFDNADSLLDAINKLNCNEYFNTSQLDIQPVGNKFFVYIPQTCEISSHNLAVLSEYCA